MCRAACRSARIASVMNAQLHTLIITVSPQARTSYLALASIGRRTLATTASQQSSSQFNRSDFSGQGFTGIYEPGQPTKGPLGGASIVGAPRITPRALKQHLDQFVVGQERAKKVLSVAVYNHYQRVQELQRQQDEQAEIEAQEQRSHGHPVEDEFPGQQSTMRVYPPQPPSPLETPPILDYTPLQIEKSNVLLLGPSGVGKTLMAKTLARVLDVPFSMSDCTPFTQAGYIGEDAEVCVQRLLAAANYDVAAAESGIICLDEIDKIATAKVAHGKDVSGEGVQQALLKIIEGTTLQIQAKPERGGNGRSPGSMPGNISGFPSSNPLDGQRGPGAGTGSSNPPKGETFNVRTDNILFICTGAFVGLHKMILDRISKGSIGFGAPVRASNPESGAHNTMLKGEDALFKKHLPFFVFPEPQVPHNPFAPPPAKPRQQTYNTLDLVEPSDLQKYGMIPELVGRIPISCALSALDEDALVRVLTEPRNSLLRQYEQLFQLSGIELRVTSGALREIAKSAGGMGTGARGLRTVLERLLGECMFETPGSHVKHILITRDVALLKSAPLYFQRGQSHTFHATIAQEEENWDEELREKEMPGQVSSFEEYRKKGLVAGAGGFM
ncbi:P-loop containing nucleoside triphosphate hydrolase protein [Clohesyomyces aquaticus]|uniref:p-loop containing nucleoside triphosphate hydrolase protein n=1 Tax=Clohesyomyces aquaticus TaxID=1231657 RepID=A0A1Y2A668_9PLEO|nr:P-loop containing nucleoside triphosphate hydrolase protein [Clohesyomyces aquaticus]